MLAIDELLEFLKKVNDDLRARGEKVPRSLLKLYVYCDRYYKQNKFEIKKFKDLFGDCKRDLLVLARGGYIYFKTSEGKDDFFNKMDDLEKQIGENFRGEIGNRDFQSAIGLLIQNLEQCAVRIRQLHERNPVYNRILSPAQMDLLNPGQMISPIIDSNVSTLLRKMPVYLERLKTDWTTEKVIKAITEYHDYAQMITWLFRLKNFIEQYCPRLELGVTRDLHENGREVCDSIAALLQAYESLGVKYDDVKLLHEPPSSVSFHPLMVPSPPFIFRSQELLLPLARLVLSNPEYFKVGTILDIDVLGRTNKGVRMSGTSGWVGLGQEGTLEWISSMAHKYKHPHAAEISRMY